MCVPESVIMVRQTLISISENQSYLQNNHPLWLNFVLLSNAPVIFRFPFDAFVNKWEPISPTNDRFPNIAFQTRTYVYVLETKRFLLSSGCRNPQFSIRKLIILSIRRLKYPAEKSRFIKFRRDIYIIWSIRIIFGFILLNLPIDPCEYCSLVTCTFSAKLLRLKRYQLFFFFSNSLSVLELQYFFIY